MSPAVSVIIPVYNRTKELRQALKSIARQTFASYEVIIVDDGSTDNIEHELLSLQMPRLRLLRHNKNRGAAAARNTGIAAANGRWIAFLDSDDTWEPSKLARQVEHLTKHAQFKACATGFRLHRPNGIVTLSPVSRPGQFCFDILLGCRISPGSTLMVERSVFSEIGVFDESMKRLEDWDWLIRYSSRYDIAFLEDALADIDQSRRDQRPSSLELDQVASSIKYMKTKHLAQIASRQWFAGAKFRSALCLETAGSLYRRGESWRALTYVVWALCLYPIRNGSFIRSLWKAVSV